MIITRHEPFSVEMLGPNSENILLFKSILNLMVEYYIATYETLNFKVPFDDSSEDSIILSHITINKFGQCRIGSEVFGLTISSRHAGQVQYFFKHIVDFEDGPVEHNLAYVRWYKPAETSKVRYYFSIDDDEETCNVEL